MRVFYTHPSAFPSDAANTVNVAKMSAAIAAGGDAVTLVGLAPARANADKNVHEFYGIKKDAFALRRLPQRLSGGRSFAWISALIARLSRGQMVVTRMPRAGLAAARLGLPVILELHADMGWLGRQQPAMVALSQHPRLVSVVVISRALGDHYVEQFPTLAKKIVVAHDGADPPATLHTAPTHSTFPRLRVGYVGHLYPGKGMEIIAQLAPLCPWADFDIVGGRPEDVSAWREHTAGIENLHLHGAIPHAMVEERLAEFDVVLAPYLRSVIVSDGKTDVARWMSPLKIFEYMAAARAMVTSDLDVIREVLTDRETALLCDPDDIGTWVSALECLKTDEDMRARLGANAQKAFLEHYTWAKRAQHVMGAAKDQLARGTAS